MALGAGEWRAQTADWRREATPCCELCGRMLRGRLWVAEVAGAERRFCEPDCEELYREYWLPRHGTSS